MRRQGSEIHFRTKTLGWVRIVRIGSNFTWCDVESFTYDQVKHCVNPVMAWTYNVLEGTLIPAKWTVRAGYHAKWTYNHTHAVNSKPLISFDDIVGQLFVLIIDHQVDGPDVARTLKRWFPNQQIPLIKRGYLSGYYMEGQMLSELLASVFHSSVVEPTGE